MRLVPRHELEKLAEKTPAQWTKKDLALVGLTAATAGGSAYLGLGKRGRRALADALLLRVRRMTHTYPKIKMSAASWPILGAALVNRRQG